MENKVKAWLYQAPTIFLLAVVFIGGIIAQASGAYKFSSAGGFVFFIIIILAIIVCFFVGKYYDRKF
jgi:hypothetical protein